MKTTGSLIALAICLSACGTTSGSNYTRSSGGQMSPAQTVAGLQAAALLAQEQEKYQQAAFYYKKILEQDPSQQEAKLQYAILLRQLGKVDQAYLIFSSFAKPENLPFAGKIAFVKTALQYGDAGQALSLLETLQKIEKEAGEALYLRATTFAALGQNDQALGLYQEALTRSGVAPETVLNNMGLTYIRMGQPKQAIPVLEHALKLSPDHKVIQKNLQLAETLQVVGGVSATSPDQAHGSSVIIPEHKPVLFPEGLPESPAIGVIDTEQKQQDFYHQISYQEAEKKQNRPVVMLPQEGRLSAKVRYGHHPSYDRIVFDLLHGEPLAIDQQGQQLFLMFEGRVSLNETALQKALPQVVGFSKTQGLSGRTVIQLTFKPMTKVSSWRLDKRLILDLSIEGTKHDLQEGVPLYKSSVPIPLRKPVIAPLKEAEFSEAVQSSQHLQDGLKQKISASVEQEFQQKLFDGQHFPTIQDVQETDKKAVEEGVMPSEPESFALNEIGLILPPPVQVDEAVSTPSASKNVDPEVKLYETSFKVRTHQGQYEIPLLHIEQVEKLIPNLQR